MILRARANDLTPTDGLSRHIYPDQNVAQAQIEPQSEQIRVCLWQKAEGQVFPTKKGYAQKNQEKRGLSISIGLDVRLEWNIHLVDVPDQAVPADRIPVNIGRTR